MWAVGRMVAGTEISGVDVVDDMDAEAIEIKNAGNDFFVYTHDLHVARMAGYGHCQHTVLLA